MYMLTIQILDNYITYQVKNITTLNYYKYISNYTLLITQTLTKFAASQTSLWGHEAWKVLPVLERTFQRSFHYNVK